MRLGSMNKRHSALISQDIVVYIWLFYIHINTVIRNWYELHNTGHMPIEHFINIDDPGAELPWASIHKADARLTAISREVSKPRDWSLWWSCRSEIWQASLQRRCRCACQIWERCEILWQDSIVNRIFHTLKQTQTPTGQKTNWWWLARKWSQHTCIWGAFKFTVITHVSWFMN